MRKIKRLNVNKEDYYTDILVEREYKQIPAIQILVYQMKDNDIRTNIF